ncbi:MAG: hypothetical protein IPH48_18245 [bacterium]|nr:hypothetical protein [bacterium]
MKHWTLIAVSACLLAFSACNESTGPVIHPNDIIGRVLDADGRPVANAVIALEHEFEWCPRPADKPTLSVRFTMPATCLTQLWITSFCDEDTVRLLVNEALPTGEHWIQWNGLDVVGHQVPDGVYWVHLVTPTENWSQPILMANLGYAGLPEGREVAPQAAVVAGRPLPPRPGLPALRVRVSGHRRTVRHHRPGHHPARARVGPSRWICANLQRLGTIDADDGASVVITLSR